MDTGHSQTTLASPQVDQLGGPVVLPRLNQAANFLFGESLPLSCDPFRQSQAPPGETNSSSPAPSLAFFPTLPAPLTCFVGLLHAPAHNSQLFLNQHGEGSS